MNLQVSIPRFRSVANALLLTFVAILLLTVATPAQAQPQRSPDSQIGRVAEERSRAMTDNTQAVRTDKDVRGLVTWVKVAGVLLLIAVLILIERISSLVDFNPFRSWDTNAAAAKMFVFVTVVMAALLAYHIYVDTPKLLPGAASEHGVSIDTLILITTGITGVAFVVIQILLTYYTYKYRSRPGAKALYYPDNHKLELLWTVIPAVGLAGMIIPGLKYWDEYSYPAENAQTVRLEMVAEQFRWTPHYPGADLKLGRHDFRQITAENPLGLDSLDSNRNDDFTTTEIHVPVNRPVNVKIRAKDVLHGFYLPHFRVNLYAVPGMPTEVTFVPTITTAEMRQKLGRPDFVYELACTQLCGASHYNMRMELYVDSQEDYDKWYAAQVAKKAGVPEAAAPASASATTSQDSVAAGDTTQTRAPGH